MSNESNVTRLKPRLTRLSLSNRTYKKILSFDSNFLYEDWSRGMQSGSNTYPLHQLIPKLHYTSGTDSHILKVFRTSALCVLASIIVYFSDYNAKIPLLAPALLLIGLPFCVHALLDIRPKTWTLVSDEYGDTATNFVHSYCEDQEQRECFEESLVDAIRKARLRYDL